MNQNKNGIEKMNLDQFIAKLKNKDTYYARTIKRFQIIYWILIPVYSILVIIDLINTGDVQQLIGGICFVVSFLIFAFTFRKFYKEYRYQDYSLPTIKMLKNAAYRYKPFQLKTLWLFIAILFMDVGLCLNSSISFSILKIQIFFIGSIIVAIIIGLVFWRIKYKPLRDNALHLVAEIEGK